MCGEKRNVTAHVFTDHWYSNSYACGGKASNRTCDCGYGYTYYPQHVKDPTVRSATGSVRVHYWICKNCGAWMNHNDCRNQNGALSCKNPGTCSVCGGVWPVGKHYIQNGRCVDCGKQIYKKVNSTQIYSDDYSTVTYTFDIIPLVDNMEVIASTCFVQSSNHSSFKNNFVKNDDGSYTIQWIFTIDPTKATITAIPNWRYECVTVDGYKCYVIDYEFSPCWMDHTAPTISDIKQTDQKSYNGYSTIKQLDISGTEDYANQITLSVSDKVNRKVLVDNAKISVSNRNWKYTCTPPLEADENGRTYVVRIEDVNGNVSTKDFTIYKTDGTAPQIESPLSYTDWTNTAKTITLTFTDYGSGDVQASLGDQTHYQACTKTADGKYQITYTFNDDIIGNKTYKLYLRDGLGNTDDYDLIIGNIDKNTYNISYNLNGGAMNGQKTSYTVADSFTLPTPTKTGYTFTGWTGSNGTTLQKTVTINKGTRGNLSYTANWSANQYSITYNANGGTGAMDTDTATYNENYVAKANQFTRTGYEFAGWTENADGSGSNWTSWIGKPWKWTYTRNITLYAQWKAKTFTITYESGGGVGDKYTQTATYDELFDTTKNKFTKTGYSFIGYADLTSKGGTWAKTAIEGTKQTGVWANNSYVADKLRFYNYTDKVWITYDLLYWRGIFTADNYCFINDFTLSALWAANDYTVTLDYKKNVSNSYVKTIVAKYDSAYGELPQPVLPGWTFKGWNTKADGTGTTVTEDTVYKIAGDSTLYAQWQYSPVSVKVPQVLTGDHTGKSQFRVKCDDFKAGNIKISVPNSFLYKQSGKPDVTAAITAKSGNNTITPTNKVCVYDITTKSGLSAGCWSGSFNIGLTLTKE